MADQGPECRGMCESGPRFLPAGGREMNENRQFAWLSRWDALLAAGFSILGGCYAWVLPRLPDPVPTHYDAQGHVNGWTDKAHLGWVIFGIPLLFWLVLWVIGWVTACAGKGASGAGAASFNPLRGFLGLGMPLLMVGCLAAPLGGPLAIHLGAAAFFACMGLGIVFMAVEVKRFLADHPDAGHYRYGFFYVNTHDPRLWVEKRLGVGWTLNYAHRSAWWVTILLLLPVAVVAGVLIVIQK
jgi:uncharacterized membrane protein